MEKTTYKVPLWNGKKKISVSVPGSKSMTNRALLLAALADGNSTITGVQFSNDSRCFLESLQQLGFQIVIDETNKKVTIFGQHGKVPKKDATINVASAGTAARFLTAMLAFSDGEYTIHCSAQMEKRPMKTLFHALTEAGASFTFLKQKDSLPVRVRGNRGTCKFMTMDISESTQFLSAILLTASMLEDGMTIKITSNKTEGAYIDITRTMLLEWGIETSFSKRCYLVPAGQKVRAREYEIEPDVSGACYFYAAAAMNESAVIVRGIHQKLMQGDMKFLDLLKTLGCQVEETIDGIQVTGSHEGYNGIEVDMNDFSDQALTLAVMAPFAKTPVTIKNIGHIRLQECDRIKAMEENLSRIGIQTEVGKDFITIYPGMPHGAMIETYDDHRVAMAFSLIGLKVPGIIIYNPDCCAKTFENYFETLDKVVFQS